jgi:hypothetical protein
MGNRRDIVADGAYSHHHDEYWEGDHLHVWFDGTTRKSLVHVYEEDWYNHQGETHHIFSLRDYNTKRHWRGHWNHTTQTVSNCALEQMNRAFEVYCPLKGANKTSSGTVSKDFKVDFYSARYDDPDRKFFEEVHAIVEYGSTSLIMQERVFGEHFNETEQKLYKWVEHREWFDMVTTPIASSVFTVPPNCPNP